MKRTTRFTLTMVTFILTFAIVSLAFGSDYNFNAHLSDKDTNVDSKAQGQLILKFNKDYSELYYKLIVANIDNVTGAHIHGMDNMIVATLYSGPTTNGRFSGILAEGIITQDDISCHHASPTENTLKHLVMCINQGHLYVNIHTIQNPGGEIRGQVK